MHAKLLVGFEDTPQGHDALALGGVLAQTTGATILVAAVYPPDLGFLGAKKHQEEMKRAARRLLTHVRPDLPEDANLETRCLEANSAAAALRRLAAEEGAELIVVGSSHRGVVGRVLPGSVGERLLGGSSGTVAVAPRGYAEEGAGGDVRPRVIGVGYNCSAEAAEALRVAAELATRVGGTLRVIAVGAPNARGFAAATAETQAWAIRASYDLQDRLQEEVERLPGELRPQAIYLRGDPATILVEMAEQGIDLLVIGAHSRGPLRALAGSVCFRVIREAPCPVLVVPGKGPRARVPTAEGTLVAAGPEAG